MSDQNASPGMYATADEFLDDRRDWLVACVVEVDPGAFDIVLRLDGTYYDRETADEVRDSFQHDLNVLLNLTPDGAA
jgi:hypothetical protein